MNELYQILGVDKTASTDEIKSAYRKLAKESHPDAEGGSDTKMKKLNEAWDTLKDPAKRQKYDIEQSGGSPFGTRAGTSNEDADINSIFENIMRARASGHPFSGGVHFGQGFQQVRRNPNTDIRFTIDLKQAYMGYNANSRVRLQDGQEKEFQLDIPAGIEHGTRITFNGHGIRPNQNLPAGDVIFHVSIQNDVPQGFHRQGKDLYGKVAITALDAITGCDVEFINIDGKKIRVSVPAGSQPGSLLKCSNYGFPTNNGLRGNLLLTVEVQIPKNLTSQQISLVKNLKSQLNV